jgi:hypothetical protein
MISALGGIKPTRGWIGDVVVSGAVAKSKGLSKSFGAWTANIQGETLKIGKRQSIATMTTSAGVARSTPPETGPWAESASSASGLSALMVYYMQVSEPLNTLMEAHYVRLPEHWAVESWNEQPTLVQRMLTVARGAHYRQFGSAQQREDAGFGKLSRAIQGAVYYTNLQDYSWTREESDKVTAMILAKTEGKAKYTITAGVDGAAAACAWVDKPIANVADPKRLIVLTGAAMLDQPNSISIMNVKLQAQWVAGSTFWRFILCLINLTDFIFNIFNVTEQEK